MFLWKTPGHKRRAEKSTYWAKISCYYIGFILQGNVVLVLWDQLELPQLSLHNSREMVHLGHTVWGFVSICSALVHREQIYNDFMKKWIIQIVILSLSLSSKSSHSRSRNTGLQTKKVTVSFFIFDDLWSYNNPISKCCSGILHKINLNSIMIFLKMKLLNC